MRPRLSVIVPLHDPEYGGGLLHRARIFFRTFIKLARRHSLSLEFVVVDWNRVAGKPGFRELLTWPKFRGPVSVRFVDVPGAVHARLPNAEHVPFLNTWARNAGVRRAQGEYILVTGADVVPNSALVHILANRRLSERAFYRIDRRDLQRDLPARRPAFWQIALCGFQDVTVHTYYGSIREQRRWQPSSRRLAQQRHQAVLDVYNRHVDDPSYNGPVDSFGEDRLIIPADGLHRNGSGEFFLMHRDRWHELRGYTELPTRGHGDSLLCWTAASAGLEQVILQPPAQLFHQPHDRTAANGWPATDWRPWYARYLECRRSGTPLITNGDDWGLRDETLPEWILRGASFCEMEPAS